MKMYKLGRAMATLSSGPFAAAGHTYKKTHCWRERYALGHPKRSDFKQSTLPFFSRRASRVHEAARSEKLLGLLSDRAQTLYSDRTFYSKQSYRNVFLILTVFGGKMTSLCEKQIFISLLWHRKYMILKELVEIK